MALLLQKHGLELLGYVMWGDLDSVTYYRTRKGNVVSYPKAPPLSPPTQDQVHRRDQFRDAATSWNALPAAQRADWNEACRILGLTVHGYNLWTFYAIRQDPGPIRTIEKQSGITLLA